MTVDSEYTWRRCFTIKTAKDDGRWSMVIVQDADTVFVSMTHGLAPEHPSRSAVKDSMEALLHAVANINEIHVNQQEMALNGLSASGNMAFTIPLHLQTHTQPVKTQTTQNPWSLPFEGMPNTLSATPLPEAVSIIA